MIDLWRIMWGDKPVGEVIGTVVATILGILGIGAAIRAWAPRKQKPGPPPLTEPAPVEEEVAPEIDRSAYGGAQIVSLTGTHFEQTLKTDLRVAELLRGWESQAQETIDYLMSGTPTLDRQKRRRQTHKDIRRACLRLIIQTLQEHKQRATYGAVAGIVGGAPVGLMKPYPKNPVNSWVVAAYDGMPSEYTAEQKDRDLTVRNNVIRDPNTLRRWLVNPS